MITSDLVTWGSERSLLRRINKQTNQDKQTETYLGGSLATKAVWLRRLSGYQGPLVTKAIWLPRPSEYKGRLVTTAVWLARPSSYLGHPGYKSCLVTKVVWLQRPSGSPGCCPRRCQATFQAYGKLTYYKLSCVCLPVASAWLLGRHVRCCLQTRSRNRCFSGRSRR